MKKFAITSGGASLIKDFSWHACPAGADFCSCKSQQNTLGALPQDPDAPERPPGKPKGGFPDRGLNGAYKVPQRICPLPTSPVSGEGNALPFAANR